MSRNIPVFNIGYYDPSIYEPITMITATSVHSMSVVGDFVSGFTSFLGGRQNTVLSTFEHLRSEVTDKLLDQASRLGADAIFGFTFDYGDLAQKFISLNVTGTAMKLKKKSGGGRKKITNKK